MDAVPVTSTSTAKEPQASPQREQHAEHVATRDKPANQGCSQTQRCRSNADDASEITRPRRPEFTEAQARVKSGVLPRQTMPANCGRRVQPSYRMK